jgi:hypothetical protein
MNQVVENFPSKCKALSSNHSTAPQQKRDNCTQCGHCRIIRITYDTQLVKQFNSHLRKNAQRENIIYIYFIITFYIYNRERSC